MLLCSINVLIELSFTNVVYRIAHEHTTVSCDHAALPKPSTYAQYDKELFSSSMDTVAPSIN